MFKKYMPIGLTLLVAAGIFIFALQQILTTTTLSKQDIINRVESLYNGQVEDINKIGSHYQVVFSDGQKVYEVQVEEEKGTFQQLQLIAERESAIVSNNNEKANQGNKDKNSTSQNNNETTTNTESDPSKAAENNTPNSATNKPDSQNKNEAVTVRISQAEAQQIALNSMQGEVEDIDFYTSADGGYYIVEIENDTQEAAFQIHAITGKILSVVYDD